MKSWLVFSALGAAQCQLASRKKILAIWKTRQLVELLQQAGRAEPLQKRRSDPFLWVTGLLPVLLDS